LFFKTRVAASTTYKLPNLLKVFGFAMLYALLAKLCLDFFAGNGGINAIWPLSGIALAVLLLSGKRYAWGLFLGSFVANILSNIPIGPAVGIACANTVEALFGAWLLIRHDRTSFTLCALRDCLRLIFLAGCLGSIVAALIGSTFLLMSGLLVSETYFNGLIHWWMGDLLGIILFTPALVVCPNQQKDRIGLKHAVESIVIIGLTFIAGQIVFLGWLHDGIGQLAKGYWMFLFVTWASLRLSHRWVMSVLIITAAQGLSSAYHDTGYFANEIADNQLFGYQLYVVILSLVGMALAAFITERKEAERKIQRLTRLYAALSQCNQSIVRCNSEAELFAQICRDAVIFGGMKMAWIGLTDPATSLVQVVASFGDKNGYLKNLQISTDAAHPSGLGQAATAIRENRPCWCQDFLNDPTTEPSHHYNGWQSSAALAICRNGIPVGAFNLYSDELNAFDEKVRRLLIEMAMDISFALDNFVREAERNKAELALQKSEQYLRTIIETEPECVKVVGHNGELIDMNQAGLAMLEAETVGEAQQQTLLEFVVPEYREAFIDMHKRVINGEKCSLEFEITGLRGARRLLETHAAPLKDETGKIRKLLGVTRDITLRKKTEKALQESEQRLALVIKGSHDAPWDWDLDKKQPYYSPQWWQMLGYGTNELPVDEELWLKLLHPDDIENFKQSFNEALQGSQESIIYELRLKHKDGHFVPILTRGFITRNAAGKAVRLSGTNMDLTERHRAQELEELRTFLLELLTSEASLSAVMDHIVRKLEDINPDSLCSILLVDADGKLKHGAAPSLPDFYTRTIDGQFAGIGVGSCGNAIATGQRTVADNIAVHPYWSNFKALAEQARLGSCWSEPVISSKHKVLGSFAIYHRYPASPSGHEIKLIETAAHFIALAIERKRAEVHLKLAVKVFEQSNEGFMITDANRKIIMINPAFTTITGYTEAEVIGQPSNLLSSGSHDESWYQNIGNSIKEKGYWQGENWSRRKNGEVYPEILNVSVVRDAAGKITEYVGVFADITQIKTSERRLEFLAHHDPLTSLPNRLLLFLRLEHGIDLARRENKQLALLMLDLDRFKDVNDSLGHLAGDQLLQMVAEKLTGRLRDTDTVARLGGDEFTVLLEDIAHAEDAARLAESIIADLSEPWVLPQGGEVRIGVSIGISLYPQYGDTPEMLLQQADTALYHAKGEGRNRFAYYSDELTHAVRERIALEARLRRAISGNEFRVYYQPQIDIASGRIVGAEALIRWQDPCDGLIPPSRFIPVAEQTGLIIAIGEWVLRETCRQGKQWIDHGLPSLSLAVNVSPYQLRQGDINGMVANVLTETGFPAERLELELTESGLMEREVEAVILLNRLRSQGIRLALDDFGTGYSSLAYLKRFPLDVLKIDKSFIDDIPYHQDDMEIAATIVAMGHTLGFKVLAEGVETKEQLAFLQAQGCDRYQGYYSSRPLPADDFKALLQDSRKRNDLNESLPSTAQ